MIAGIGLNDWYKIAGIIVAAPVALTLAWGIFRIVKHMGLIHEAIAGRDKTPISAKIPSMIERFESVRTHLDEQDVTLDYVKGELTYNGGGSTKDQLRSVSLTVEEIKNSQTEGVTDLLDGQRLAKGREDAIAGTAVRTAADLHDETEQTAAAVAVKVAEAVEKKLHPAKKAAAKKVPARKRVAEKKTKGAP